MKTLTIIALALLTGCATQPNEYGESAGTNAARKFVRAFTEKEYYDPFTGQTGRDSRIEEQLFGNRTP